jgi:hypothetical protein
MFGGLVTPDLVTTVGALALAALGQFAALLIWGAALTQRVRGLEREVEPLKDLGMRVARIDARLEALVEQLRDLNAAIRWMRQPSETTSTPAR